MAFAHFFLLTDGFTRPRSEHIASQPLIDPEQGSEIARVGEAGGFEDNVVKSATAGDEGFDCCETSVSNLKRQVSGTG
ncbi:MAG: hypothetical protein Q9228_004852 [Teloschistes exilis]